MDRLCAYEPCSKPLVPRDGEKPSQLARRNCCNASCANRKARGSTLIDLPAEKTCTGCGVVIRPGAKEPPSRWAKRRFCTRACTSRYTVRVANRARLGRDADHMDQLSARVCARDGCGKLLVRRANEKLNRFQDRECCSFACANSVRQTRTAAAKPVCARPGCTNRTKKPDRKFCSRDCQGTARRTPGSRRSRQDPATQTTRATVRTPRQRTPEPAPPLDLAALRPDAAALIPDPGVIDMDRKRAEAGRMLDEGTTPHRIAQLLGVSVAQVNRWDRGDR